MIRSAVDVSTLFSIYPYNSLSKKGRRGKRERLVSLFHFIRPSLLMVPEAVTFFPSAVSSWVDLYLGGERERERNPSAEFIYWEAYLVSGSISILLMVDGLVSSRRAPLRSHHHSFNSSLVSRLTMCENH